MTRVAGVQRTHRIDRRDLDPDRASSTDIGQAKFVSVAQRPPDLAVIGALAQEEIEESRTGDLHLGERRIGGQRGYDGLGEPARLAPRRACKAQREVAREVAATRVFRALHLDADFSPARRHHRFGQPRERLPQPRVDQVLQSSGRFMERSPASVP